MKTHGNLNGVLHKETKIYKQKNINIIKNNIKQNLPFWGIFYLNKDLDGFNFSFKIISD